MLESFLSNLVLFLIDSKIIDDNAESESEDEEDENLPTSKSLLQNELEWVITSSLHGLQPPFKSANISLVHTQKTLRLQQLFLKLTSIHSHILFILLLILMFVFVFLAEFYSVIFT